MATDYAADLLGGSSASPARGKPTDYASEILAPAAKPAQASAAPGVEGPTVNVEALKDTLKDLPAHTGRAVLGLLQGMGDIPVGVVQLISKAAPDKVEEAVAEFVRDRETAYKDLRGDYADRADVGRITGNVVASIPMGGKTAAATLPGRMVQGSKVGAALGAATPVNPDSESFWTDKAIQVGGGAVAGAVAVPVVEGLVRAAGAAVNGVANVIRSLPNRLTNKATQDAVEQTLTVELQKEGIRFADLSRSARDALVLETQKALKSGGTIDPSALQRLADAQKLGIPLTRGQASRDPLQFATERNLGKTELGKPIADRLTEQNTSLIAAVDAERGATGAVARDAYDAGKSALNALQADDEAARKAVKAAYDSAKQKLGMEADVPLQPLSQRLGEVIEEVGSENIPGAVMSRLKDFGLMEGKQTRVFNIREAEKLRKLIGNNMPGQRTPTDAARAPLRQAIDEAVDSLGAGAGGEAAAVIEAARATAKGRFQKIESIPLLADLVKKKTIPPEDVVSNYVLKGSVDEVGTLMKALPPGARRDVRGAVLDFIKGKAVSGSGDAATFSQAGFNKALEDLGERHLKAIFSDSPQIVEQLARIGRVAANVQKAPVSSGVNYSSSATTLIDMLDKVGRLPVLGAIAGKPGDMVRATQVTKSLQPQAPVVEARPLLGVEFLDDAARSAAVVAPAAGAAIPMGLSRP